MTKQSYLTVHLVSSSGAVSHTSWSSSADGACPVVLEMFKFPFLQHGYENGQEGP